MPIRLIPAAFILLVATAAWGGATKVTLCHVPPGEPENAHTITVGEKASYAHLGNHDDTLGACGPPPSDCPCIDFWDQNLMPVCGVASLQADVCYEGVGEHSFVSLRETFGSFESCQLAASSLGEDHSCSVAVVVGMGGTSSELQLDSQLEAEACRDALRSLAEDQGLVCTSD